MKKFEYLFATFNRVKVGVGLVAAVTGANGPAPDPALPVPIHEYLNEVGAEGWQLVSTTTPKDAGLPGMLIFVREKEEV